MRQLIFFACMLTCALGLNAGPLAIEPPETMNFQGVLRDDTGAPRNGDVDVVFRFFDAAAGGNEILIDRHELAGTGPLTVSRGLFSVQLGSGQLVDGASQGAFDSIPSLLRGAFPELWLQIEIDDGGGYEVLSPRVEVVSTAFALRSAVSENSADSDRLGGNPASTYLDTGAGAQTKTGLLNLLGGVDLGGGTDDDLTDVDVTLLTGGGLADALHTHASVASADDADTLDGLDSSFFLDTSADDQVKTGSLTVANMNLTGNEIDFQGPDRDQDIEFFNGESALQRELLRWDDSQDRLIWTDELAIVGPLRIGTTSADPVAWNQIGIGAPDSGDVTNGNDLYVGNDIELDSVLYLNGTMQLDDDGPDGDQFIYFYGNNNPTGEFLQWDELETRFEMSDALAISGAISTGDLTDADTFNRFGSSTPNSGDISSVGDALISFDLEVGDQIYMSGANDVAHDIDIIDNGLLREVFDFSTGIRVGDAVGENVEVGGRRIYLDVEGNGGTPLEYLEFLSGEFNLSDDLDIFGSLTANSKNFVQNHPTDVDLEIVYTTLEGPEAGVFTRGSARLSDGAARVALEESFAWVANPDIGLTVYLTPRGAWADLYVESVSASEIVVRSAPGSAPDAAFDYMVMGLHVGYEGAPVVRPRTRDAALPTEASLEAQLRGRKDLARFTPLARYADQAETVFGRAAIDRTASLSLAAAIGRDARVSGAVLSAYEERAEVATPSPGSRRLFDPERDAESESLSVASGTTAPEAVGVTSIGGVAPRPTRDVDADGADGTARKVRLGDRYLALRIPITGDVAVGDVLVLDPQSGGARRSTLADDATVIGVAVGEAEVAADGLRTVAYAVAGVVECRVVGADGVILPGDTLVTATVEGHATPSAVPFPGTIVGKALDRHDGGAATVRVLLSLR